MTLCFERWNPVSLILFLHFHLCLADRRLGPPSLPHIHPLSSCSQIDAIFREWHPAESRTIDPETSWYPGYKCERDGLYVLCVHVTAT